MSKYLLFIFIIGYVPKVFLPYSLSIVSHWDIKEMFMGNDIIHNENSEN